MRIKADGIQFPKHFIRAGEAFNTFEAHVPAPYFRKTFSLPEAAEGEILITACGFYELYLNGKRITKGALAPSWHGRQGRGRDVRESDLV